MRPSDHARTKPSSRKPFTDVSSKANALANLPKRDLLLDQIKSGSKFKPVSLSQEKRITAGDTIKPFKQTSIAPVNAYHQNIALPRSSRTSGMFQPLKTHVGPWELGNHVGRGGTCHVRMVRHCRTGIVGVAKVISKATAEQARARSLANLSQKLETGDFQFAAELALPLGLEREIVIMRLLDHPNIVRLFDVWENGNKIYIIMENIEGGELFKHINTRGPLRESDAIFLFRQLVEAMLYCHSMKIYHRDLKPENILIDKDLKTIKLIDFGMAAYQPAGHLLQTPCGSPHYAAPELLEGLAYDGSKVDVWSLTVVLFVMLTNEAPFNFDSDTPEETKLKYLYAKIKACRVTIPESLSIEAKDLLRRAFVKEPNQRISIADIWNHPLLHKYDQLHGKEGRSMLEAIGQAPAARDWLPLYPGTIDKHIFRNLRTLWHDVDEDTLVSKLCNDEHNAEKHFYTALVRYRMQQLKFSDCYQDRVGVLISESDFHHGVSKRHSRSLSQHARSGSQFSVFQSEHLKSKHSFFDDQSIELNEDHFGAISKEAAFRRNSMRKLPISDQYALLMTSSATRRRSLQAGTLNGQYGAGGSNAGTRRHFLNVPSPDRLHASLKRSRPRSQYSTNSSSYLGSHSLIVVAKPSTRHKKNVSFDHRHRRSAPSGTGKSFDASVLLASSAPSISRASLIELSSSPPMMVKDTKLASLPKNNTLHGIVVPMPRVRRNGDIERAARKVSSELGDACHKAFFGATDSEGSSRSSASGATGGATETPPTSLLSNLLSMSPKDVSLHKTFLNRPLPPTPHMTNPFVVDKSDAQETPHTYTERELSEMRQRLLKRYGEDGADHGAYFKAIIRQLDSLMQKDCISSYSDDASPLMPFHTSTEDLSFLHSIPEEGRFNDSDELLLPHDRPKLAAQAFARSGTFDLASTRPTHNMNTIRIVTASSPPSTPTPLAPLKIRKVSTQSTDNNAHTIDKSLSSHVKHEQIRGKQVKQLLQYEKSKVRLPWWRRVSSNTGSKRSDGKRTTTSGSDWDHLDDRVHRRNQRAAESTHTGIETPLTPKRLPLTSDYDLVEDRYYNQQHETRPPSPTKTSNYRLDRPHDDPTVVATVRQNGFLRGIFQRKSRPVYGIESVVSINLNNTDALEHYRGGAKTTSKQRDVSTDRNLLDRLLRFKPETKVLVMSHPRKASRVILHRVLMQESGSGIVDVLPDGKNRNAFVGRLVAENKWRFKPVSFAIELFSILRDGKQSQLTAVRFTQTHGSASSLRRLVHLVCQHLENRHLHTDAKETKEIARMIQTGRLSNKVRNNV